MDEQNNIPTEDEESTTNTGDTSESAAPPEDSAPESESDMSDRLERLGGEPAPVITPDEFASLQKAGQVHIDSRGRVRTARRSGAEAGVSLRKRRAWYR